MMAQADRLLVRREQLVQQLYQHCNVESDQPLPRAISMLRMRVNLLQQISALCQTESSVRDRIQALANTKQLFDIEIVDDRVHKYSLCGGKEAADIIRRVCDDQ